MSDAESKPADERGPATRRWPARVLLALAASFALAGAVTDSPTVDEPGHLAAGLAVLHASDFRLAPDHPPLARVWAALPVWLSKHQWPGPAAPGWHDGDWWAFGAVLLRANDAFWLIVPARAMLIVLALLLCLAIESVAHSLFGPQAGLLALTLAAFDPTLLAHAHYVTTDLPAALMVLLVLWSWSRLAAGASATRLLAACASVAVFSLTKFAWLLALPSLAALGVLVTLRAAPFDVRLGWCGSVTSRAARALVWTGLVTLALLVTWGAIWCAYGLRYSPFRGADAASARMYSASDFDRAQPTTMDATWETVFHDPLTASERSGPLVAGVRWLRAERLLPEAYLYGFAYLNKKALQRASYFLGDNITGGHWAYFLVAFLIKTPLGTLLLFAAGLGTLIRGAWPRREHALLVACATFALVYTLTAARSGLNIGQRHLLPLYPIVFVVAGASVTWVRTLAARVCLWVAVGWVALASVLACPQYLGYFNEIVGGWRQGHLYLADSNIDWGQDMWRLERWARVHPTENLKLARNGEDVPLSPDFLPESLWGEARLPLAALGAGTYVVSATELLGVYKPLCRDAAWRDTELQRQYRQLWEGERLTSVAAQRRFEAWRRARLIVGLRSRPADERVGRSLFVWRLTAGDVELLTRP